MGLLLSQVVEGMLMSGNAVSVVTDTFRTAKSLAPVANDLCNSIKTGNVENMVGKVNTMINDINNINPFGRTPDSWL